MTAVSTVGVDLHPWQTLAVDAWVAGTDRTPFSGTLEIVTGGGKTLIALECFARASQIAPDLRLVVVVPTAALAHQWRRQIAERTSVLRHEIGLMGAGGTDGLIHKRALVCVLNSAADRLVDEAKAAQPLMLVVDECHRAGAPKFSKVLDTPARFRLGLSATPDREEFDDDGEPLLYDEQIVGKSLGRVVYTFNLRDAREAGWLPEYTLNHHGITLGPDERAQYDALSRRVDDAADGLAAAGGDTSRARQLAGKPGDIGDAARRWIALTSERKDLLFRAAGRAGVASRLVAEAFGGASGRTDRARAILFHERVDQAEELFELLRERLPDVSIALEHSRLPSAARSAALDDFRAGRAQVLVSVKSLVEGIDVPEADLGVSVASTSSVRQRVQALGRVLRRATSKDAEKHSVMHLVYVRDSVDELIYAKADWSDLTGADRNRYWLWPVEGEPESALGPPMSPRPTEEQVWDQLEGRLPADLPVEWPGVIVGQEYTADTMGNVRNGFGRSIGNPQGAPHLVELVRGRPGGRFRVTPAHRLVLVSSVAADRKGYWLAGRLDEPFEVRDDTEAQVAATGDEGPFRPGDPYAGPPDKAGGTFKVGQRAGGIIERRSKSGRESALLTGSGNAEAEADAVQLLRAWRSLALPGLTFHVNTVGDAWFESAGERRFLAVVRHGFVFPADLESRDE